jgi:small subunit ribosomal protein S16
VRRREMVKIRLMRMGAKKRPFFRVVVADARSPRDGRFIENIGKYHPLSHPSVIEIDEERALHWLRNGAQPTDPARVLLQKTGVWSRFTGEPAPPPLEATDEPSDAEGASASPSGTRGVPSGDASAPPAGDAAHASAVPETEGSSEAAPLAAEEESEGLSAKQADEAKPGTREGGEATP